MRLNFPKEQPAYAASFEKGESTLHCFRSRDDVFPLELEFPKNGRGQGIRQPECHEVNRDSVFPVR